jgi:hypothetical protein
MERCVFCQGPVDAATGRCQQCGQVQPARSGWVAPAAPPAGSGMIMGTPSAPQMGSGMITRPCPFCGEVLPVQARFCGRCGNLMPPPMSEEEQRNRGGMVFIPPYLPGTPASPSGFVGAPAGPQVAAPGVASAPAGPQSGMPSMPTAPGAGQSGFPPHPPMPPGGQPWGGGPPSTMPWAGPPAQQAPVTVAGKGAHALGGKLLASIQAKIIAAVLAVAVVGTAAAAAYVVTRPQPVIQLKSSYSVGNTPAGASSTSFTVSGQKFSSNALVTFLLDGRPVPDTQPTESDNQGNIEATLLVTDQWSVGRHTLTATDANGYTTRTGILLEIVAQGGANTPSPNGSPTDLSTFTIQATTTVTSGGSGTFQSTITVTKGAPCDLTSDTGQPVTRSGTYTNTQTGQVDGTLTYTIDVVCSGSYQNGKLNYIETVNSLTFVLDNGNTCQAQTPYTSTHYQGSFSDPTTISGMMTGDAVNITCARTDINYLVSNSPWAGTWTGTVTPGA